MFKKNLIIKVVLSIITVGIFVLCVYTLKDNFKPTYDGSITVEIVAVDGTIIKEKEIPFNEGDLLVDLISNNFENVTYESGMIMSILDYTTPSDWSTFISIYVNDEASLVGLKDIAFENGTKISFIITEYNPDAWS